MLQLGKRVAWSLYVSASFWVRDTRVRCGTVFPFYLEILTLNDKVTGLEAEKFLILRPARPVILQ